MSTGIPSTTTGTVPGGYTPPSFFGGSGGTPATGANGSLSLTPATTDLYGTGMNLNEAYDPVNVGGQQSTISQQLAQLGSADPGTVLRLQQELYHAGYLPEVPDGSGRVDAATYKAYLGLLRDANRSNSDINTVISNATAQTDAQGGPQAKAAATPRVLGLGKFPVKLTSPIQVAAVVNATAQQLTGMDATGDQIKAITDSLHSAELTAGMADYQQYVGQEEAFYESQHGGVANKPGAPGGQPSANAAANTLAEGATNPAVGKFLQSGQQAQQATLQAGASNPQVGAFLTAGQQAVTNTLQAGASNPAVGAYLSAGAAAGQAPTTPGVTPTAGQSAATLPANAITLSDGTILIPPQQLVSTNAPDASAMAAQALRGTPQYTAYNALQAYDALAQLVKGGGH